MTTQEKLIRRRQSLLELGEYLHNISQACKIHGVSRQHSYDIRKACEEDGLEGLRKKSRRKPCSKNRVAPEVEEAVLQMAYEYPAYGQARAANELRKKGILVSGGGIRSIWLRHGLETFKKRLNALEEKSAQEGIVYTEAQLVALEVAKRERESVFISLGITRIVVEFDPRNDLCHSFLEVLELLNLFISFCERVIQF